MIHPAAHKSVATVAGLSLSTSGDTYDTVPQKLPDVVDRSSSSLRAIVIFIMTSLNLHIVHTLADPKSMTLRWPLSLLTNNLWGGLRIRYFQISLPEEQIIGFQISMDNFLQRMSRIVFFHNAFLPWNVDIRSRSRVPPYRSESTPDNRLNPEYLYLHFPWVSPYCASFFRTLQKEIQSISLPNKWEQISTKT